MTLVYRSARRVLNYLGEHEDDSEGLRDVTTRLVITIELTGAAGLRILGILDLTSRKRKSLRCPIQCGICYPSMLS